MALDHEIRENQESRVTSFSKGNGTALPLFFSCTFHPCCHYPRSVNEATNVGVAAALERHGPGRSIFTTVFFTSSAFSKRK